MKILLLGVTLEDFSEAYVDLDLETIDAFNGESVDCIVKLKERSDGDFVMFVDGVVRAVGDIDSMIEKVVAGDLK